MDKAQQFLDWWHRQRADDTALYPDPKAIARDAHSKNPKALVIEFENRWPLVRVDVFKLLEGTKKPLAKQFKAASVELVSWAKHELSRGFIESVSHALTKLREGTSTLDRLAASFWPGQKQSFISDAALAAFRKAGCEDALAKGRPLHNLVETWLRNCTRWYESAKMLSTDVPPLLLTLQPCVPWIRKGQESIFDKLEPASKPPIRGVLTADSFLSESKVAAQVDWHLDGNEFKPCAEVFELVLRAGTLFRFENFPESVQRVADAASINPWCVAVALDRSFQASDAQGAALAHDWLAQVQVAFDSWVKTRKGDEFREDTSEYGMDFRPTSTNAPLIRHLVGCFAKPRNQRPLESCAYLIGFALDSILDDCRPGQSQAKASHLVSGAQRKDGREGQIWALINQYPHWSKAELAKHLGIDRSALSRGKLKHAWNQGRALLDHEPRKGRKNSDGQLEVKINDPEPDF